MCESKFVPFGAGSVHGKAQCPEERPQVRVVQKCTDEVCSAEVRGGMAKPFFEDKSGTQLEPDCSLKLRKALIVVSREISR